MSSGQLWFTGPGTTSRRFRRRNYQNTRRMSAVSSGRPADFGDHNLRTSHGDALLSATNDKLWTECLEVETTFLDKLVDGSLYPILFHPIIPPAFGAVVISHN